jgi:hypothetical protein
MRHKLRTARTLSAADWQLFAQAWWLLLVIDLGLRALPFKTVQARLAEYAAPPSAPAADPPGIIQQSVTAVERAARNHFYQMTCLRRALTLQVLLARRGVAAELRIGVKKIDGALQAHAWLEFRGEPINEAEAIEKHFAPLAAHSSSR